MQTDPHREQDDGKPDDAANEGASSTEPAEGADDAPAPGQDSPGE